LFYQDISAAMKDSLYGAKKFRQLQRLVLDENQRQQQAEREQLQYRNKVKYIILFIALGVFLLVSFLLFRNNRLQKKAKTKVEAAYSDLEETQQQMIQREKMASLGELTAGIAHEIQNPLNFVNNFSEVNTELIEEMKTELKAGNTEQAIAIANDISDNEQKINHHGKRADAIVKGMLQHSRSSSGVKEPTGINKLADEYLRLAYHGLRAKDKSFNASMKTDYDETIGNINIISQDIGRVILNLINNAFYAASLPSKGGFSDPDKNYNPTVWVSTKKVDDKILISVRDNGPGIPNKILDKIFQPFFTTKPTGQGTGLGLSLSYDIIKAHGGEIKVQTKEGEGAEFIITLPD
jgi:two-component system, NtrC family, sensor kinase